MVTAVVCPHCETKHITIIHHVNRELTRPGFILEIKYGMFCFYVIVDKWQMFSDLIFLTACPVMSLFVLLRLDEAHSFASQMPSIMEK